MRRPNHSGRPHFSSGYVATGGGLHVSSSSLDLSLVLVSQTAGLHSRHLAHGQTSRRLPPVLAQLHGLAKVETALTRSYEYEAKTAAERSGSISERCEDE